MPFEKEPSSAYPCEMFLTRIKAMRSELLHMSYDCSLSESEELALEAAFNGLTELGNLRLQRIAAKRRRQ